MIRGRPFLPEIVALEEVLTRRSIRILQRLEWKVCPCGRLQPPLPPMISVPLVTEYRSCPCGRKIQEFLPLNEAISRGIVRVQD
jgi:hypothetical protein